MYFPEQLVVFLLEIGALLGRQRLAISVKFDLFIYVWVLDLHLLDRLLLADDRLLQKVDFVYKADHLSEYLFLCVGQQGLFVGYDTCQRVELTHGSGLVLLREKILQSRVGPSHGHHVVDRNGLFLVPKAVEGRLIAFGSGRGSIRNVCLAGHFEVRGGVAGTGDSH